MFRRFLFAGAMCVAASAFGATSSESGGDSDVGAVYTMTNAAGPNSVMIFNRAADGSLTPAGMVSTGGTGTGAGLGSQGSLVLTGSHRWLLAANAGSNDITVLAVNPAGLTFASKVASGGLMPISITVHGTLVYVLNAGSPNNITGFRLNGAGMLTPIPGSTQALSAASAGPAQVQLSPDQDLLLVTEKATNLIDAFPVGTNGLAGARVSTPSNGLTPFGFAFGKHGQVIVSEAFGGAANASALSSYVARDDGSLTLVTGSAPNNQTAACWVVVNSSGRVTYTANTGSASVTGFRISASGALTILTPGGVTGMTPPGSSPIDESLSSEGQFLYVLTDTLSGITGFQVGSNGALTSLATVAVPSTAVGLAVR